MPAQTDRELLKYAVLLHELPLAQYAHSALLRITSTVLATGREEIITDLIRHSPASNVVLTLRHAAELASERALVQANRRTLESRLFAIPLLLEFDRIVPETQIDSGLQGIAASSNLAENLDECSSIPISTRTFPRFFAFTQLAEIPLFRIRAAVIALGSLTRRRQTVFDGVLPSQTSARMRTVFSRYIVGHRLSPSCDYSSTTWRVTCKRLQDLLRKRLSATMGPTDVSAFYSGTYYNALYTGMWLYQQKRLQDLARSALAAFPQRPPKAFVTAMDCSPSLKIRVEFRRGHRAATSTAYLLSSRPGESSVRAVERVVGTLKCSGLEAIAVQDVAPISLTCPAVPI